MHNWRWPGKNARSPAQRIRPDLCANPGATTRAGRSADCSGRAPSIWRKSWLARCAGLTDERLELSPL